MSNYFIFKAYLSNLLFVMSKLMVAIVVCSVLVLSGCSHQKTITPDSEPMVDTGVDIAPGGM